MSAGNSTVDAKPIVQGLLDLAKEHGLWALVIVLMVVGFFWRGHLLLGALNEIVRSVGTIWTEHTRMERIQDREDAKLRARVERLRSQDSNRRDRRGGSGRS